MSSGKSNNDSQQRTRKNFNLAILQLFLLSPRLLRPIQIITRHACEIPSTLCNLKKKSHSSAKLTQRSRHQIYQASLEPTSFTLSVHSCGKISFP